MELKKIAVLGAGWLGLPLIRYLADAGHGVRGSYRRQAVREAILDVDAQPYLLDLPDLSAPLEAFLEDIDTLVVTLPPRGRSLGERATEVYLSALSCLGSFIPSVHLIYTSSTGVYGSSVTGWIDEGCPPAPDTDSSRAVVAAESWLASHTGRVTILRLAGLFGPGRDPATFFRQREVVTRGDAPVNMVHQEDALLAIETVMLGEYYGIFNVCAGTHPPKRAFYASYLERAGLPSKIFLPGGADGKRIDSTKLRQLGWSPRHDTLS